MKFSLYKIYSKEYPFKQSAIKKTWKLFSKQEEDISLFNSTKINDGQYHIVFHLSDEHVSRTKKGGFELTVPFSQYVNAFLIGDIFFLENNNKNYTGLIINYIEKEYDLKPITYKFDNQSIMFLLNSTKSFIKKVEITDEEEEEDVEYFGIRIEELKELANTKTITFINFLYGNVFISVNKLSGGLSINTKDEEELLEILGVTTSAISDN